MKKLILMAVAALFLTVSVSTNAEATLGRKLVSFSSASVAASSTTLIPANKARNFLFVQNIGTTDLWFSFNGAAAVGGTHSIKIIPGASMTYEGDVIPINALTVFSDTSTGKVVAYEG